MVYFITAADMIHSRMYIRQGFGAISMFSSMSTTN